MEWHHELRVRFPALRHWTYLNAAGAGPLPLEVAGAALSVYEAQLAGGDAAWEEHLREVERARASLGELIGAGERELAFTRNTSHSASLVAQMLRDAGLRRAVALADEFPSSTLPFLNRGFSLRLIEPDPDGRHSAERIEAALEEGDVLVASQVVYRTGEVNEPSRLGAIAARRGATLVLNATQAVGALRLDFRSSGAAFAVGTSHKWLCAGYGGGWLAMREELIGRYSWPVSGWLSASDPDAMRNDVLDPAPAARALEMGCPPFAPLFALGAACRLWLGAGPERVEARVRQLTAGLRARLAARGWELPPRTLEELSGITVLPVDQPELVCARLQEQRVATTARSAGIRFAVHAYNDESDLDRAVEALSGIVTP